MNTLILLAALTATPGQTSTPVIIENVPIDTGMYYLILQRNIDGSVSIVQIPTKYITSLSISVPPPPDPVDPLEKTVIEATNKVNDNNKEPEKKALSTLYMSLAGLPFQNREALQKSTDLMFNALGLTESWQQWKKTIDKALSPFQELLPAKEAWKIVGKAVAM